MSKDHSATPDQVRAAEKRAEAARVAAGEDESVTVPELREAAPKGRKSTKHVEA